MEGKCLLDIVINKEQLSDGSPVFVAHCLRLGIASQGMTVEEAMGNIKEAIELYLEEQPDMLQELSSEQAPVFSVVEVSMNGKIASSVG